MATIKISELNQQKIFQISQIDTGYISSEPSLMLSNAVIKIDKTRQFPIMIVNDTDKTFTLRCQTTNSPIRAWNIYESSPFSRKKFLSLCSIVKTTEWNGLIKIDN